MQLNPHVSFNGQCESAFKFYEKCLGGKILFVMTYGDSPMAEQTPPDWRNKIMHATFALGDDRLTGADALPETYQKPKGFSVMVSIGASAEAVQLPIQETFWALRFGMVVDQFGTPWIINCGKPA